MILIKKIGKLLVKVFISLLCIFLLCLLVQYICCKNEIKGIRGSYGKIINVFGKNMCVDIMGHGKDVIVIYPGAEESSPVLLFKPLAETLSKNYTVVIVEPFGYGLSDANPRERTVENASEELHEAIKKLGYDKYILMAHSYGGITTMYYMNKYPGEVEAFVGLDTTVAEQNKYYNFTAANLSQARFFKFLNDVGIIRLVSKFDDGILINNVNLYTKSERVLFRKIYLNVYYTDNMMNELKLSYDNSQKTADMVIPNSIPVYYFLSTESADSLSKLGADKNEWYEFHKKLSVNNDSKIEMLKCGHYVQCYFSQKIANDFNEWYQSLQQ